MKSHASMNRIYRLVWNQVLNAWVAVAETAKGRGKGSSRKLIAAALSLSGIAALAGPQGGQVVAGAGAISQSGNTTTINQTSQNLSLSWQSFNVAKPETVNFVQPSASAIAVNRIQDTNASQILGHLNANGQVYLINPNGILFGQGAQVNVGALVASTLDVSDSSLNSNSRTFSGKGTGSVINQGTINAGYVALLGNHVSNQGVITAQLGTVALGAGSAATLTFNGNSLVKMQIDQSTLNNLVENGGLIRADGGMVIMNAGAKDALLASVVNNSGVIEARTVENHEGSIILLGGMTAGTVHVGGTLDASAPTTGNGGFIETSAAHVNIADTAKITTTAAANGLTGTWLIDPADFTIAATGGNITGAALGTALNSNSVTIQTATGGTSCTGATCTAGSTGTNGDINVNDTVSWSGNYTLTLNAYRNININSSITATGTTGALALYYGQGALNASNTATYNVNAAVNLMAGNNFSTKLGSDGSVVNYTVITALGLAGDATTAADTLQGMAAAGNLQDERNYVLGADIDAGTTSGSLGTGFIPIGNSANNFSGIFDGLGHTISNLTINKPSDTYVGLFGYTNGASAIRNVGLIGGSVSGMFFVGGLVGNNGSTISNSYATGSVTGTGDNVGGLVGLNNGKISNSYATGSVTGTAMFVGGLAGGNNGKISNSYATGSVTGTAKYVGGLVGDNSGTISNSYATGSVSGRANVGGLVGYNGGTISMSFYDTETSGQSQGIAGTSDASGTVLGVNTANMKLQANFTDVTMVNGGNPNWDFTTKSVWGIDSAVNNGYPYLCNVTAACFTQIYLDLITGGTSVYGSKPNFTYAYYTSATYGSGTLITDAGESGTIVWSSGAPTSSSNVDSYSVSYLSGITLGNSAYKLAAGNAVNWSVTPAPLTVTGTAVANKTYDGGLTATLSGGTLLGTVNGDILTLTLKQAGTFASKNAGTGIAVTAADTLSGAAAGNYTLTQPTDLFANITRASLSISGITAGNKVYDATTAATLTGTAAVTALGADSVTLKGTGSGSFVDKNVGTGKAVTVSGYTLGGTDADNYTLNTATTADITPLAITVALNGANKVYDGDVYDHAATLSSTGVISGDKVAFVTDVYATFADKNVGNAKTVSIAAIQAIGTDARNYTLNNTTATTTADITAPTPTPTPVLSTPPAPVLNATTQLALNVVSPQAGNRPDMLSLSPTITVTQRASLDKGDANTDANSSTTPSVNVAMNIGGNGPALQIISGGMRLPTNLVNVNE